MNFKKLEKEFQRTVLKSIKKVEKSQGVNLELRRKVWVEFVEAKVPCKLVESVGVPRFLY